MHATTSNHPPLGQHSRYIGRVGALAVALGVGLATSTTYGLGVAHADTDDGPGTSDTAPATSSSRDSNTRAELRTPLSRQRSAERPRLTWPRTPATTVEAPDTDATSDRRSPTTSASGDQEAPNTRITLPDKVSLNIESATEQTTEAATTVGHDVPDNTDVVVVAPEIGAPSPGSPPPSGTNDTETDGGGFSPPPVEDLPPLSQTGPETNPVREVARALPRIARPEAVERVETIRERLAPAAQPTDPSTPTTPQVQHSNPITGLFAIPVAAVVAVPAIVSKVVSVVLSPLLSSGPGAPVSPPLLWNVLTWAVREIQNTFFNRRPRIAAQTIDVSLNLGDTTGPISFHGFDPDGNPVTYTVSTPKYGTVTLNQETGEFTYTLTDPDHTGTDQFTVTISDAAPHLHGLVGRLGAASHASTAVITLNISAANHAPVAVPDSVTTYSGTPVTFSVTDNDSDPDGDPITVTLFTDPEHGTLVHNDDGTFTYTPDQDFVGVVTFLYTIKDTAGLAGLSMASITVLKPPVPLDAEDDAAITDEDTPVVIDVLGNDTPSDAGGVHIIDIVPPANGTVVMNTDGTLTYTPNQDWNGVDTFDYVLQDAAGQRATATVHVTVNPVNDAPVVVSAPTHLVLDEDSDGRGVFSVVDPDGDHLTFAFDTVPQHGVAIISNGVFDYKPHPDFHGTDEFTITVHDGHGGSTTILISVTVNPVDDPPQAPPLEYTIDEDTAATGNLVVHPIDADGQQVRIEKVNGQNVFVNSSNGTNITTANGVIRVLPNGQFHYSPNADFSGTDTLTYTVVDAAGNHATSTLTIHVRPVNDPPVAVNDTYTASASASLVQTFSGNVLANDFDVDNPPPGTLRAILVGEPESLDGSLGGLNLLQAFHLDSDGSFEITVLAGGLLGILVPSSWAFTYRVTDGESLSDVATVTIRWT